MNAVPTWSRRGFLSGCVATGGLLLAGAEDRVLAAPAGAGPLGRTAPSPSATGAIDVHHHILPPGYVELARDYVARTSPAMSGTFAVEWSPARSLEDMDRHGIATAVLSMSAPGISFADRATAARLARLCNEYAAAMKRDHPRRFGSFAALPLPHADQSLAELEYALDTLRADGVGLMTSYGDRWPGHADFAPVYAELNRRKAVVYFHPTAANCCVNLQPELHAGFLEFPFDSTRAIASLLYSGAFARWPDIRWIFSHGGGALAAVHSRLVAQAGQSPGDPRFPAGANAELRRLHYDVASVTNAASFAALAALIPPTQLLLGTDFPLGPPTRIGIAELAALPLDPAIRRMIERDNALRLFPRLA